MTGQNKERDLARQLDESGYHVMRAPSSGSATKRDLPDLLWSKHNQPIIAAELKYTGENVAYFGAEEVRALMQFANAFGAEARLCARFKRDTDFYVQPPEEARRTPEGNYAIDQDMELDTVL